MMFLQDSWFFLVFYILISTSSDNNCVQGKCLNDQRDLLLQLNQSLTSSESFSPKRGSWHLNTDCCSSWDGISCDRDGNVISLDVSQEHVSISVQDDFYNGLFKLQYLERLNLAENSFSEPFPSHFDQLLNLEYLNLSNSGFHGKIPIEVSRLTRLVILDLSIPVSFGFTDTGPVHYFVKYKTTLPDPENLTRNLTQLRELHLSGVDLSEHGNKWCRIFSSYLPKLQVLNLVSCGISGPFESSLQKLRSLSILNLNYNNISAEVPNFFCKFRNLTTLHLRDCKLHGKFPEKFLQLQTLQSLDLSSNDRLEGSLPDFPKDGLLQELMLSFTSFSGELPSSIGNLRLLSTLYLQNCAFNGSIPTSFSKLNQLEYINLSNNSFTGLITSISSSENLVIVDLSHNRLTGPTTSGP
ncbi:hypothetical protein MKW92_052143 [Papaver armeniacum]|nr:hypothetical protein MKW92_052143 [Papaver armeniacum]